MNQADRDRLVALKKAASGAIPQRLAPMILNRGGSRCAWTGKQRMPWQLTSAS